MEHPLFFVRFKRADDPSRRFAALASPHICWDAKTNQNCVFLTKTNCDSLGSFPICQNNLIFVEVK